MKGLSLTLPYPYLIAAAATRPDLGKCWETRDWAPATWRGELAIHAARNLAPVGGRAGLLALCAQPSFAAALAVLGLDGPAAATLSAIRRTGSATPTAPCASSPTV